MRNDCPSTTVVPTPRPALPEPARSLAKPAKRASGLALALLLASSASAFGADTLNRIIIRVNDQIVTQAEYQQDLQERLRALERPDLGPASRERFASQAPAEVMKNLFEEALLLARAAQMRIRPSEAELEETLNELQKANGIASREDLRRALAQSGQSWEEFRKDLITNQLIQTVIGREINSRIKLEEDNLRIYYRDHPEEFRVPEQRKLVEIVVLDTSPISPAEQEALAQEISRRLNAGEDPATVAAAGAEAGTTSSVIDLDWVPKGDLDGSLEEAIDALEPGQASRPILARGGLHVIQLVERKEAAIRPFEEVEDEIWRRERGRLFSRELPKYLRELEAKSYVVLNPPPGAEDFRKSLAQPVDENDPIEAFRRPRTEAAEPAPAPQP